MSSLQLPGRLPLWSHDPEVIQIDLRQLSFGQLTKLHQRDALLRLFLLPRVLWARHRFSPYQQCVFTEHLIFHSARRDLLFVLRRGHLLSRRACKHRHRPFESSRVSRGSSHVYGNLRPFRPTASIRHFPYGLLPPTMSVLVPMNISTFPWGIQLQKMLACMAISREQR